MGRPNSSAESNGESASNRVSGQRLSYIDKEGTTVSVILRNAAIDLLVVGEGIDVIDLGRQTIITGATEIHQIRIVESSARSNLTFTTRARTRGGDTAATIGSIVGDQTFGSIMARDISLAGDGITLTGDGIIERLMLRRILADVVMPGTSDRAMLTALSIEGANITTGATFRMISAEERIVEATITAASIGSIMVRRGNVYQLSLALTDASARSSLTTLMARNTIDTLTLDAAAPVGRVMSQLGDVNGVTLSAPAMTIFMAGRGAMNDVSLTLTDQDARQAVRLLRAAETITDLTIDAAAPLGNIMGESIDGAHVTAPAAGVIRATRGDIDALDLLLTDPYAPRSLGALFTRGWLTESTLNAAGEVATVLAGAMRGTAIRVGVASHVTGLPDAMDDFSSEARLRNVRVTGIRGQQTHSFIDSYIAAWDIGTVNVPSAQSDNANQPFGVAGVNLGRVRGLEMAMVEVV